VLEAVSRLSVEDRDLLELLTWEGLSRAQLATVFGVSQGAIAVRIYRARRRLAAALTQQARSRSGHSRSDLEEAGHA
jgi:RNA polymerase sigma-70 factor (ECF subfamily)